MGKMAMAALGMTLVACLVFSAATEVRSAARLLSWKELLCHLLQTQFNTLRCAAWQRANAVCGGGWAQHAVKDDTQCHALLVQSH